MNRKASPTARNRLARTQLAEAAKAATGKMFYSPEDPIRVTLPDGAVAIIERTPRTLPQKFWRPATRAGALVDGGLTAEELKAPQGKPESDPHTRAEMILNAVLDAARAPDDSEGFEDAFNTSGTPNVRWIETRVGFGIDAAERDQAWAQAQIILDEEERNGKDEDNDEDEEEDKPDVLLANKATLAEKGGTFSVE